MTLRRRMRVEECGRALASRVRGILPGVSCAPPLVFMQLSDVIAPQVTPSTRSRGLSYFESGAVTSLERYEGIVEATVRGSEDYDVWIEPIGAKLRLSCTCPHFLDHLQVCKHIWATLLAAEGDGIPLFEGPAPSRIQLELVADPYDDDQDSFEDEVDRRPARTSRVLAPHPPAPAPQWQTLLNSIAGNVIESGSSARPQLREGQLLYVIDIDASLAANAVVIELMTRERKANGEWGKPKPARVMASDVRALPPGPDRQILERLLGARPHYEASYGYVEYGELSCFRLQGAPVHDVLPLLCGEDRCLARVRPAEPEPVPAPHRNPYDRRQWQTPPVKPKPAALLPLHMDNGPAWCFGVTILRDESAGNYRIDGFLRRGDQHMAVSEPLLVLADGILVTTDQVARLDHKSAFGWLAALRQSAPIPVPFEARPALIDALLMQPLAMVEAPDELHVEVEDGRPRPVLRLSPERMRPDRLRGDLSFDYGDELVVRPGVPNPLLRTLDASRVVRRDFAVESEHVDTLRRVGFRREWTSEAAEAVPQVATDLLPGIVRSLLASGWHVEAKGVRYRHPAGVSLAVSSGIDWFDLEGHVDYGDRRVELPALLAAAKRGDAFITLDDGTMGLLPEEWLRKHGALVRLGSNDGGRLRFKSSHVALLDALLAAQPAASFDEVFGRARQQLQAFDGIAALDPPSAFAGTLRHYQREGLGWLVFLRRFGFGGCLADDMGLGKTVMVLALLDWCRWQRADEKEVPALVVAPRSLVFNWRQEAARFTPHLRVLDYTGSNRAAARDAIANHDLVLTTYGTLRRDIAHLQAIQFEYVVLDEAQAIKNAASASAKATRLLTARHRLALSGTPIENHLGEILEPVRVPEPGAARVVERLRPDGRRPLRRERDAVDSLARIAAVHPAPNESAGRTRAAGQDRTNRLL